MSDKNQSLSYEERERQVASERLADAAKSHPIGRLVTWRGGRYIVASAPYETTHGGGWDATIKLVRQDGTEAGFTSVPVQECKVPPAWDHPADEGRVRDLLVVARAFRDGYTSELCLRALDGVASARAEAMAVAIQMTGLGEYIPTYRRAQPAAEVES